MRYKWQIENEVVFDTETNASINVQIPSPERAAFNAWIAAGNTPDDADPEIILEKFVSKLAIVDRLEAMGEREAVKSKLAEYPYMLDRWNAANEISTSDAQVRNLLAACGINPDLILY